jgi:hypothetical protein
MGKELKYIIELIEWMGMYREWYKNNAHATKDGDPKPPIPPPPTKPE